MTFNLTKLSAFTVILATMGATHVFAVPVVTNKMDVQVKCRMFAFNGHDYVTCGAGYITIEPGAKHEFTTGGTAAFNKETCAADPKPGNITSGYSPWKLQCNGGKGLIDEAYLGVAGDLSGHALDVATPKTVTIGHDGQLKID